MSHKLRATLLACLAAATLALTASSPAQAPEDRVRSWSADLDYLLAELLDEGRADDAFTYYRLNIESYPGRARPYLGLAFAYQDQGRGEEARELFERALEALAGDVSLNRYERRRLEEITRRALSASE